MVGSGPVSCQRMRPLRAKSRSRESRGREPSGGGGVEGPVRGVASLHRSAPWGCARATGRQQEAHAAGELGRGYSPLPALLDPRCMLLNPAATLTAGKRHPARGRCGNSTCLHQTRGCDRHVRDSATAGKAAGPSQLAAKLSLLGEIQRRDAE